MLFIRNKYYLFCNWQFQPLKACGDTVLVVQWSSGTQAPLVIFLPIHDFHLQTKGSCQQIEDLKFVDLKAENFF